MRPEIAPETLAQMEVWFQECLDNPPPDMEFLNSVRGIPEVLAKFKEAMFAGWWLENQLIPLGASKQQISDLCFAHGQHCFGRDPWEMAEYILDGYKSGNPETPGPELAERIFNERVRIVEE